jgi:hypothetical protein
MLKVGATGTEEDTSICLFLAYTCIDAVLSGLEWIF